MAWVELSRYEAESGDLPEVCMRCGEPATVRKRYGFPWHPTWVSVLIPLGYVAYFIVAAVLRQNVRCTTFLCDRHKSHWRVRTLLIWGAFLALVAVLVGGLTLASALSSHLSKSAQDWMFGSLCIAAPVLLVCWFISIPIIQGTAIHPTDVTERRLRLKGVSPLFVAAVQEYRQSHKEAMLPEDYARKFQPERGRRTGGGREHYAPADGGRDQLEMASAQGGRAEPREEPAPRKAQARPRARGLTNWAEAFIILGLVAMLLGALLAGLVYVMQQQAAVLARPPQRVTLAELAARGPGDNPHVVVTDFTCGSGYVYETHVRKNAPPPSPDDPGYGSKAWIPLFPKGPPNLADAVPEPTAFTVLLQTEQTAASPKGIHVLSRKPTMEGIVQPLAQSGLKPEIRDKLTARYPRTDFNRCLLLVQHEGREKEGYSELVTLFAFGSGGGLLLGLLALTLGIALWRKRRRLRGEASGPVQVIG